MSQVGPLAGIPFLILAQPSTTPSHLISAAYASDALHLTLGCQSPLNPSLLNNSEFPACAAMTTGYVFRVENEATVHFLQTIGTTGALTHLKVSKPSNSGFAFIWRLAMVFIFMIGFIDWSNIYQTPLFILRLFPLLAFSTMDHADSVPAFTALTAKLVRFVTLAVYEGLSCTVATTAFRQALLLLLTSRVLFAFVLSKRIEAVWHGAAEPGVNGSLLVLLSRDRWVRMDGAVDDLKAVTSGSWLRPATGAQEVLSQMSCLMAWLAVLVGSTIHSGAEKLVLVAMVLLSHGVVSWRTTRRRVMKEGLVMHDCKIEIDCTRGENGVKKYCRRLDMAEELIKEFGRRDWAEQMGMVKPEDGKSKEVIM